MKCRWWARSKIESEVHFQYVGYLTDTKRISCYFQKPIERHSHIVRQVARWLKLLLDRSVINRFTWDLVIRYTHNLLTDYSQFSITAMSIWIKTSVCCRQFKWWTANNKITLSIRITNNTVLWKRWIRLTIVDNPVISCIRITTPNYYCRWSTLTCCTV